MHFDDIPPWLIAILVMLGIIILAGKMQEAGISMPDYGAGQRMLFK